MQIWSRDTPKSGPTETFVLHRAGGGSELEVRVYGLGFRVLVLGFGGLGFRKQHLGFGVSVGGILGFSVEDLRFKVWGLGLRGEG